MEALLMVRVGDIPTSFSLDFEHIPRAGDAVWLGGLTAEHDTQLDTLTRAINHREATSREVCHQREQVIVRGVLWQPGCTAAVVVTCEHLWGKA